MWILAGAIVSSWSRADESATIRDEPIRFLITDEDDWLAGSPEPVPDDEDGFLFPAAFRQPQPLLLPSQELQPLTPLPQGAVNLSANLFGNDRLSGSALARQRISSSGAANADVVFGTESQFRLSTDAGNLLGKSPSALGLGVQRRTPIVTDPRVRGSRVGRMAASGSYWVPARIDLDTMLSKIDSRIIDHMIVTKGPYSSLYGPDFNFVDVQLLQSPRYQDGYEWHGSSSADYKTNGQQWYGRQTLWGGLRTGGCESAMAIARVTTT